MSLVAPPGYQSLVLLDRSRHRRLGVRRAAASFAASLHAIYVSVIEFVAASRCYPVVFAPDADGGLHPFAVVGLEPGQNLWVDDAGTWRKDAYCPAYVRRYPFCTVEVTTAGAPSTAICVDEQGLDATPPHLFDASGRDTPRWREIQRFVEEMDVARRQTESFCRELSALDLLEDFEADINPTLGRRQRLIGMRRVNEDRLKALSDAALRQLLLSGHLARIYAHLMSLDNFHQLLQLDMARRRRGEPSTSP